MAIQKVLTLDSAGNQVLKDVGVEVSAGAADAGKAVVLKSDGTIDSTLLGIGFGADTVMMVAFENLNGGDFVNVFDDTGTFKIRKADATTAGKQANGFVLDTVTATTSVKVYFEGTNTAVTSVTAGNVFLSTTAGGFTATAPSTTGNVVQKIGIGISATSINVEFNQPVLLA